MLALTGAKRLSSGAAVPCNEGLGLSDCRLWNGLTCFYLGSEVESFEQESRLRNTCCSEHRLIEPSQVVWLNYAITTDKVRYFFPTLGSLR